MAGDQRDEKKLLPRKPPIMAESRMTEGASPRRHQGVTKASPGC
ncbi:MAG: hypothetical protein AVDCRST_MAG93-8521 [uncultured Chloroflexia bacterium]|uniref:Uncharacterized protein n=1 Tax=uncultured Chloroflexia bacterium TaxID=1672391 RepID=A0A6J4N2I9_9CHLR|nr:MAG: hypothetical protein AVDCRST_MAG93-8521 [uncultured Chloroflexia bacterium]